MDKCLVTGGAGFIGSNLVDELVRRGDEVIVIDNLSTGKKEYINSKAEFHQLDIRDLAKIKPLFTGVDFVFHLAAFPRVQPSIEDPVKANDINLNGTLNVLVAARDAKVKKVVYSASSSAYGMQEKMPLREDMPPQPLSPYGLQKYVGELYGCLFSKIYGLPTVSLRYFNVYGPRQALEGAYCLVMGIFVRQRLAGKPMTIVGDGEQRRDFTSVVDVVRANILATESDKVGQGEVINIGRGKNYSVNELARMIGGPTALIPSRIEPKESLADNSLAKKLLGWQPTMDLPDWLEEYKKEMGLKNQKSKIKNQN
jgi:UDP-glucose 4-epimerase